MGILEVLILQNNINKFFIDNIGFIPFDIKGEIKKVNNGIEDIYEIYIENNKNEAFEIYLKKYLTRMLKSEVKITPVGNNSVEYFIENWQKLIIGNNLYEYLMLLLPIFDGEKIIFKTFSKYVVTRLKREKSTLNSFIARYIGNNINYEFELDDKLKPDSKPMDYYFNEPSNYYNNTVNKISNKKNDIIIIGNNFKKIHTDISSIQSTEGRIAVIKGKVFYKEFNDKNNIVSLYVTDNNDSIVVKHFASLGAEINSKVNIGDMLLIEGSIFYDTFIKDFCVKPFNLVKIQEEFKTSEDNNESKRVELHSHSKLSQMDGIIEVKDLVKKAKKFGHKAIAITDHGAIQSIPQFYDAASSMEIKAIYGLEANVVDDFINIININTEDQLIDKCEYVVFDFETTGLQPAVNEIIEIGAVKVKNGEVIEKFHSLIKPEKSLPPIITKITGIDEDMLKDKNSIEEELPKFLKFIGNSILVAHNADFDYRFLREWVGKVQNKKYKNTYIDTLSLSKSLMNLSGYSLDKVVKGLNLGNFNHHRADEDAHITALVFLKLIEMAMSRGVKYLSDFDKLRKFIDYKSLRPMHMTVLVKNRTGLKNLYKLVSNSHVKYFYRIPRILKSELSNLRDGLLIGSGCENGELCQAFIRGATKDELLETAKFFDYIEIMPIDSLEIREEFSDERAIEMYKMIYEVARELDIPAVMTGNVHYLEKHERKFRTALKVADKKRYYKSNRYFRTTDEMLDATFKIFNNKSICEELVIKNSNLIADSIEEIQPLKKKLNPPNIENAENQVRELTMNKAYEMYGEKLPEIVMKRLERELNSIIKHGYSVLYLMAQKIVKKSNDDGYLVGSRGSVGSSLVATMMGITEVNPLPPHYYCPKCKKSIFFTDGKYGSGYDLPDKKCEDCNIMMKKNGQDIPFETFMGFEGDKIPDIDLNFSGEYQARAHKYVEEMFGTGHVFKAGTISTVAERTAFEYARKYSEKYSEVTGKTLRNCEMQRIANAITGVKRTTGQHPGGLMIVPKEFEIFDFTPIQFPANDTKSDVKTTHFDYHVIHDDLVKLDALGHDDPTFIRMLTDLTGISPFDIPMDDKKTMSIFSSTQTLNIDLKNELNTTVGSLGIPEFGTNFVRRMLEDTRPKTFAELVRISGLSHGTDVWSGNAKNYIDDGIATLNDVIACRDDIMNYLILKGADPKKSFFIMEKVRKGKGLTPEDEELMKNVKVPEWFLNSCKKIKYLFPKAHAAAYVSMAFRIAWFKVHKPLAFYATYFSVKGDEFNLEVIIKGKDSIKRRLMELRSMELDVKKKNERTVLEIALEMLLRGFSFKNVDLYRSDSKKFLIDGKSLIIPFIKIPNLGEKAAKSVIVARNKGEFQSIEELISRTGVNKSNIETLKDMKILDGLPDKNQMSLFGGI
jgi:DNA polymerase-3 subunit alpha (Gram-positive type)